MPIVYPKNRYVSGTYKRECDICGFDFLRSEMTKDYKGRIVCKYDLDSKHEREAPLPSHPIKPFRRD